MRRTVCILLLAAVSIFAFICDARTLSHKVTSAQIYSVEDGRVSYTHNLTNMIKYAVIDGDNHILTLYSMGYESAINSFFFDSAFILESKGTVHKSIGKFHNTVVYERNVHKKNFKLTIYSPDSTIIKLKGRCLL